MEPLSRWQLETQMVHSQHRRGAMAAVPGSLRRRALEAARDARDAGSRHVDYRISMYQPMAHVKLHRHKVQEQVYHVLAGEGLMEIAGEKHVVRTRDYIFLPPGVITRSRIA
jgi:quercetin dioxygenase-like cupin family protein